MSENKIKDTYVEKKNYVTKNCSDLLLVEKKYSSDLKMFANFWPSALNFKSFSQLLEQFFLTVGQNNFGNKIPILPRNVGFGKSNVDTFARMIDLSM